jgi:hypothetical protein
MLACVLGEEPMDPYLRCLINAMGPSFPSRYFDRSLPRGGSRSYQMSSRIRTLKTIAIRSMALLVAVALRVPATAQKVPSLASGFDTVGFIQAATVDVVQNQGVTGDLLSGGTIKVNDHVITVPKNAIVQMPAATLSWGQVFAQAPANVSHGGTASGLALADCLPPVGVGIGCLPGTWEAHVQGNVVLDPTTGASTYLAGLIFLSQQSLNSSTGFIDAIDYTHGILIVGGRPVMVNDPPVPGLTNPVVPSVNVGRHTIGQSPDTRFTVDQENPTVRSETGYPMCIPRVDPATATTEDPRCPQRNRPRDGTGALVYNFTMAPPRLNPLTTLPDPTKTDPWEQMPFEVGDSVTYWGVLMPPCQAGTGPGTTSPCLPDLTAPQSNYMIAAYQVIGNAGAYTFPGSNPAYIGLDVILQGTGGVPNPAFPQEVTSKVKVEGFSTDDSRTVDIFAMDTDCNGIATDRLSAPWALAFTVDPGPPTGAKRGRFRFRPIGGAFLPPVIQPRVRVTGYTGYLSPSLTDPLGVPLASPTIAANGLVYGQYHAPDFAFVFPENLLVGNPVISYNFQDFPELVNGIGPLNGHPGFIVGQLSPWPDLAVNTPTPSCLFGAPSPTLNASFTATPNPVIVNNPITLDASAAIESGATSFTWSPLITCANFSCSSGTFTPTKAGSQIFTLKVTGAGGATATSSVTVTVNNPSPTTDVVTLTNVVYRTSKARLDVNATSSIVMASPSNCTVTNLLPGCMKATLDIINTATGQPYTALMQNLGNGTYSVTFTGLPAPNLVTVQSGNGGSATGGVTRVR